MLTRYWQWTSAQGQPAASGVPFGPLRFRAWTSPAAAPASGVTGLPFGPLRYRAWTNGVAIVPPVYDDRVAVQYIPVPDRFRRARMDDEELLLFVAAWVTLRR